MMKSVFLKTLYERRYFMLGWTIGLIALSVLIVVFFPAMRQDNSLDALIQNMPAALQSFVGDLDNLRQFDRYLASQLFDIRVSMVAGIMAIILGVGLSTREEESGELRSILAHPISRTSYFMNKWLAMLVIILIAVVGLIAGVYMAAPFIDDASIAVTDMINLGLMTWLIMAVFATVTLASGFVSGKRSVATLIGILVIVGSFIITSFSSAVDWLKNIEAVSLLHYFTPVSVISDGIDLRNVAVLCGVAVACLIIAWAVFRKRDIN